MLRLALNASVYVLLFHVHVLGIYHVLDLGVGIRDFFKLTFFLRNHCA